MQLTTQHGEGIIVGTDHISETLAALLGQGNASKGQRQDARELHYGKYGIMRASDTALNFP